MHLLVVALSSCCATQLQRKPQNEMALILDKPNGNNAVVAAHASAICSVILQQQQDAR